MAEKIPTPQNLDEMIERYTQDLRRFSQSCPQTAQPQKAAQEQKQPAAEIIEECAAEDAEVAYLSLDTPVAVAQERQEEALQPCECETPDSQKPEEAWGEPVPVMGRIEFEEAMLGSKAIETDEIILDGSGHGARFSMRTGTPFYPNL